MHSFDVVTCGASSPDPHVESKAIAARARVGAPRDEACCGKQLRLEHAYRCVECGRWAHRACLEKHFAEHQTPRSALLAALDQAAAAIHAGRQALAGRP